MVSIWNGVPDLVSTTPFDISVFNNYCDLNSYILDIGCGYGRILKILEDNAFVNLYGIDSSEVQLRRADKSLTKSKLIISNALSIPFADNCFDCAITFGLINNFVHKDMVVLLLAEVYRVLKDDAIWFVNLYSPNHTEDFKKKYRDGFEVFSVWGTFKSNAGFLFRHYPVEHFLGMTFNLFETLHCEKKSFLSMNHTKTVNGYSIILRKIPPNKTLEWSLGATIATL